jgi:hypothetical protein
MSQSTVPRAGAPVAELSFDDVEDTAPSTPYPRMRLRALVRRLYATWCAPLHGRARARANARRFLGLPW